MTVDFWLICPTSTLRSVAVFHSNALASWVLLLHTVGGSG